MAALTQAELNTLYQEELGRNADVSGMRTYLDPSKGYSADEVRGFIQGSLEKRGRTLAQEREEKGLAAGTYEDFNSWWREFTGANKDADKALYNQFLGQKYSIEEMKLWGEYNPSVRKQKFYGTPQERGEEFYKTHADTDEFTATEGGQVVWLKEGTPVDSDYYEDVTDQYQAGIVPSGYRAYVDTGSKGGSGIVASIGSRIGMSEFESDDNWLGKIGRTAAVAAMNPYAGIGMAAGEFLGMKEGYAAADAYTLNTGTRFAGGERTHQKSVDYYTDTLGLQEGEYDRYADIASTVVVSAAATILAPFTGGQSLWMVPAFTAWQGSSRRVGGTRAELDNESWADVAENTAWASATAAAGGSPAPTAAIAAARAKSGGASWESTGYVAAGTYATSQGSNTGGYGGVAMRVGGAGVSSYGYSEGDKDAALWAMAGAGASEAAKQTYIRSVSTPTTRGASFSGLAAGAAVGLMAPNADSRSIALNLAQSSVVSGLGSNRTYSEDHRLTLGGLKDALSISNIGATARKELSTLGRLNTWVPQSVYRSEPKQTFDVYGNLLREERWFTDRGDESDIGLGLKVRKHEYTFSNYPNEVNYGQ